MSTPLPTAETPQQLCATCRFARDPNDPNDPDGWMDCHRRSPTPIIDPQWNDDGTVSKTFAYWPLVDGDDWCGEWEGVGPA